VGINFLANCSRIANQARNPSGTDLKLLSKKIIEISTECEPTKVTSDKNPHAVALGELAGKKGGSARANKLSPEDRSKISRKAAKAKLKKEET